jgi:hypothetical protein
MTAGGSSQTCSSDKPDALRVLCVTGQKMCRCADGEPSSSAGKGGKGGRCSAREAHPDPTSPGSLLPQRRPAGEAVHGGAREPRHHLQVRRRRQLLRGEPRRKGARKAIAERRQSVAACRAARCVVWLPPLPLGGSCFCSPNRPPPAAQTANVNRQRLFACCGEDGPAPSGAAAQGCINDVSAFNQDKSAIGNTCAASELPQGGPGLTQKVGGGCARLLPPCRSLLSACIASLLQLCGRVIAA